MLVTVIIRASEGDYVVNLAVVGLGKMGLSHLAIARAHRDVNLAGVCDSTGYVLDVLQKYTGVRTYGNLATLLDSVHLDAVVIATPTHLHAGMVTAALERGLHVFCEKPLCLSSNEGRALTDLAEANGLVTQVGYHNRFVASFAEVKNLLDHEAIGRVTHVLAEAYGPVVLAPKSGTWRSVKASGGGCLYDYAAHPIDLLTWFFGPATAATGSVLGRIFSGETEDEVYSTLHFGNGVSGQLSVNWSDESQRKMTTSVTMWGTQGQIHADRQEVRVYLRRGAPAIEGYRTGWNIRYTTELTRPVAYYLRGEEYSAQMDAFVARVGRRETHGTNSFRSGVDTDRAIELIVQDADRVIGLSESPKVNGERIHVPPPKWSLHRLKLPIRRWR
jgi:predicted dehydrogenase